MYDKFSIMHVQRFFSYLSLFTFMMLILVTGNNYLLMFVGWEGVGVCSYLLVNFWFTRIAANTSAISAFLTNRVGDWILTVGMFTVAWTFGKIKKIKTSKNRLRLICLHDYAEKYPILPSNTKILYLILQPRSSLRD